MDFFSAKECSILTLVSFPSLTLSFSMLVILLWIALIVVYLERNGHIDV